MSRKVDRKIDTTLCLYVNTEDNQLSSALGQDAREKSEGVSFQGVSFQSTKWSASSELTNNMSIVYWKMDKTHIMYKVSVDELTQIKRSVCHHKPVVVYPLKSPISQHSGVKELLHTHT